MTLEEFKDKANALAESANQESDVLILACDKESILQVKIAHDSKVAAMIASYLTSEKNILKTVLNILKNNKNDQKISRKIAKRGI